MTDNPNLTPDRDDLVARLNLMEAMIAEGRQATIRFGWILVLWGLVDLVGMAIEMAHHGRPWTWPVVISTGLILQFVGSRIRRRTGHECAPNSQARICSAVWGMMGVTLLLYCFTAIFSHHAWGSTYFAAIFMTIGFAHAASAIILRWGAQGAVAALFWAGGLACFFLSDPWFLTIFCVEMLFGMVFFGLYAMWLERREGSVHA